MNAHQFQREHIFIRVSGHLQGLAVEKVLQVSRGWIERQVAGWVCEKANAVKCTLQNPGMYGWVGILSDSCSSVVYLKSFIITWGETSQNSTKSNPVKSMQILLCAKGTLTKKKKSEERNVPDSEGSSKEKLNYVAPVPQIWPQATSCRAQVKVQQVCKCLQSQSLQVRVPALPFTSCLPLGRLFSPLHGSSAVNFMRLL